MPLSLGEDGSTLSTIGSVIWVLQLGLLVHVFKTGRPYWWFWVLLAAPVLGGVLYLLVEILPDRPRSRGGGGFLASLKPRSWRIRDLRTQLAETDVVRTRLDLAEELLEAGQKDEAHTIALEALQGVFRNDPHTVVEVARFKLAIGRHQETLDLLRRAAIKADRLLENEKLLLEGRAYLGIGDLPAAAERFRFLHGRYVGDEPRYHLAVALLASRQREEAVAILHDIMKRFRRASRAWRRTEKPWFQQAKQRLKELGA